VLLKNLHVLPFRHFAAFCHGVTDVSHPRRVLSAMIDIQSTSLPVMCSRGLSAHSDWSWWRNRTEFTTAADETDGCL